jgi:methyl-accepting chemotaxis protein
MGGWLSFLDGGARATLESLDRSQAIIEFAMDGTILKANANFLTTFGYGREEVVGNKHAMLMAPADRDSAAYQTLWEQLREGHFQAGQFRRLGKDGREVWIEGAYNPMIGPGGRPTRVVKLVTDITGTKQASLEAEGQLAAISRSQAVIEFALDGTILAANEQFLSSMG